MLHSANVSDHPSNSDVADPGVARRQRLGLILLALFSLAYAGFIGLCTFAYEWIAQTRISGIPLTVVFGAVLICLSLLTAMLYGYLSRTPKVLS